MKPLSDLEDQAWRALQARQLQYEREISKQLYNALTTIHGRMTIIYNKYAKEGILTKAEMTQYNRYASMEAQIMDALDPAIKANVKTINKLRPDEYDAGYFRAAWAMDNGNGIRLKWGTLNRDIVLENIASEFYKISIERYGPDAKFAVRAALNKGLSLGKSYQQMADDLEVALNTTNYNALRIARTEGQTAMNAGQADAYLRAREQGVEGDFIWDATLDGRTRPDHADMDQKARKDDGFFDGPGGEKAPYPSWEGLSAGQRISCRCRLRFQVAGYTPQLRRTRDQGIIPYQTFQDWDKNRKHWR